MGERGHVASSPGGSRSQNGGIPSGVRVVWDGHARLWRDGNFVTGGSPWRLMRLGPAARAFARRLRSSGTVGLVPQRAVERATADLLVDRGIAHPTVESRAVGDDVVVVVPAYGRPELLDACLRQLTAVLSLIHISEPTRPY